MKDKIDFVILWVDGSDPKWLLEKEKYNPVKKTNGVNGAVRFRDWDNLQYWFRGVEKYAPWVNNIYFITWGHLPKWLNTINPKLKIIKHQDFIPEKYLPTFSSHPIELNIHRIKGLSEKFVLFNDDVFLINDVKPDDFFKNNLPMDNYNEVNLMLSKEDPTFASIINNNYQTLNNHFKKRSTLLKKPFKYLNYKYGLKRNLQTIKTTITKDKFVGINNNHLSQSFLKSYFEKVWTIEESLLNETSLHKFRNIKDINIYLIRYFQLLDGSFYPRNYQYGKYFSLKEDNSELLSYITKQKGQCVCINDSNSTIDFEKTKTEINNAFDKILSEKCSFEK